MKRDSGRGLPAALWPTDTQKLLLTTALGGDEEARRAWDEVQPRLDLDHLETGSFALTPMLYRRLEGWKIDDPSFAKLKGLYRHTWYRNQVVLAQLKPIVKTFGEAQLELLVAGGSLLLLAFYREAGLRPAHRLDLVVHPKDVRPAMEKLSALDWHATTEQPLARLTRGGSAWFRRQPDGPFAVLRPKLFPDLVSPWTDAISVRSADVEFRGISAARQLLWTCLGQDRLDQWGRVEWLADAHAVVTSKEHDVDWRRLLDDAASLRAGLRLRDDLAYARESAAVPVPVEVLEGLAALSADRRERLAHRISRWDRPALAGRIARRIAGHMPRG